MSATATVTGSSDAIEVEELPDGWKTAWVTYKTSDGVLRGSVQIIDLNAKPPMQYYHDSMRTISIKCALLVLAIPFFAVLNMVCYAIRTFSLVLCTFGRFIHSLCQGHFWEKMQRHVVDWTFDTAEIVLRGSWDLVRLPFLALEMQLCCVYGIFSPLSGRAMAGAAERAMRGSNRSHDMRRFDVNDSLYKLLTDKDAQECLYWAVCFQPIGPAVLGEKVQNIEYLSPGIVKS